MRILHAYCLLVFTLLATLTYGQSTAPNAREPGKKQVFYAPRAATSKKVRKPKVTHTPRYEFYERIEKAAHEKKKILRKHYKAQYSDPRNFGHKRIPKRRASHKMRYCNECGIRH